MLHQCLDVILCTGWRRPIECLKLQVIFRKRATNHGALLHKMTYEDKTFYNTFYGSSPPCSSLGLLDLIDDNVMCYSVSRLDIIDLSSMCYISTLMLYCAPDAYSSLGLLDLIDDNVMCYRRCLDVLLCSSLGLLDIIDCLYLPNPIPTYSAAELWGGYD